jgi:CheY-like chemotaxis protein
MEVLIIDDDEICLLMLSHGIRTAQIHESPRTFNKAGQGLEFLGSLTDPQLPVVIFLDINMPELNGWEFLDILQQLYADHRIDVVMITSSVCDSDKKKARSYPSVIDFIIKPFRMDSLEKVKDIIKLKFYSHGKGEKLL